jgi:hypothetical protein
VLAAGEPGVAGALLAEGAGAAWDEPAPWAAAGVVLSRPDEHAASRTAVSNIGAARRALAAEYMVSPRLTDLM